MTFAESFLLTTYSDRPDLWPVISDWHWRAWRPQVPFETVLGALRERHENGDGVPWGLIALDGEKPVATTEIKINEMREVPEHRWWIGEVFVLPEFRGGGLAERMVRCAMDHARGLGLTELALQTAHLDGGLYGRVGFRPVRVITREDGMVQLLMRAEL